MQTAGALAARNVLPTCIDHVANLHIRCTIAGGQRAADDVNRLSAESTDSVVSLALHGAASRQCLVVRQPNMTRRNQPHRVLQRSQATAARLII